MSGSQPPLRPPSLEPPYGQPFPQRRYQPPPGPADQPSLRERMASLTEGVESLTTLVSGSLTTLLGGESQSGSLAEGSPAAPDEQESPDRAIGIVSELKSSAALFAAFAFGALNLPGTLTISESRVTSAASSALRVTPRGSLQKMSHEWYPNSPMPRTLGLHPSAAESTQFLLKHCEHTVRTHGVKPAHRWETRRVL